MREVLDVLPLPLPGKHPRIAGHVGDRIIAAQIAAVGEPLVHHAEQAIDLVAVAIDRVGNLLRRIGAEVIVLTRHRTEAAHLPEQPFQDLVARTQILADELAGLVGEVNKNGADSKIEIGFPPPAGA